jgi:hypothetical protein
MKVIFTFFIEAKDEVNAKKVLNQIIEKNNLCIQLDKIEKYEKINGYKIKTYFQKTNENWEKVAYELIKTAQGLGYNWNLTGNIDDEINMTTNNTKISGLKFLDISCNRYQD